jgi:hypothetical protein
MPGTLVRDVSGGPSRLLADPPRAAAAAPSSRYVLTPILLDGSHVKELLIRLSD